VDEDSLRRPQPVCMLLACCNPSKLKGTVQLFHKKWGYNIRVTLEEEAGPSGSAPPPAPHAPGEDDDDEDVDDLSPLDEEWDNQGHKAAPAPDGAAPGSRAATEVPADAAPSPMAMDEAVAAAEPADAQVVAGQAEASEGLGALDQGATSPRGARGRSRLRRWRGGPPRS
jgi:hypothetical protein